jgi:exodeoxyribonuclease VII small subunit
VSKPEQDANEPKVDEEVDAAEPEQAPDPERVPDPAGDGQPSKAAAPKSYEAAVGRLEQVIERLDTGETGLRETLDLCREGRGLIAYCASELGDVDKGFEELRLEQLAAQLEFSELS